MKDRSYTGETAKPMSAEMAAYMRSIRNPAKRAYADQYWHWRRGFVASADPPGNLSYMAAQAVRIRVEDIMRFEDGDQSVIMVSR